MSIRLNHWKAAGTRRVGGREGGREDVPRMVIKVRHGVATSGEGITDLDDFLLDSGRLVEDDEDHLLLQLLWG